MPTYAYRCAQCGAAFEVQLSFAAAEAARPRCPACGSRRAKRRITAPGLKVKRGPALTRAQIEAAAGYAERKLGDHAPAPGHADD